MKDLKGILASRVPFYSKADYCLDTSAQGLDATYLALVEICRQALAGNPHQVAQRRSVA
jgi:XRE family aerobic/anaerobic benzoate catabolism transcriptional regulator